MSALRRSRSWTSGVAGVTALAALAGCGGSAREPGVTGAPSPTTPPAATTTLSTENPGSSHAHKARRRRGPATRPASATIAYSNAPADIVQPQPRAGSCHALGTGRYARPDPHCTPGALNPAVTQATIGRTICMSGWTATVRPPENITESEKRTSMAAYGDRGTMSSYEYDHFVPLELGGAVNDPRNLWPEPGANPNPKDTVEDELRQKVCDGQMTLARAQRLITANWTTLVRTPSTTPSRNPPECSVSATYNSRYHDYDVYVHSNQPDESVTVTDGAGHSDSWHTDSSGYADVYFHAGRNAAGLTVTARVGAASCSTML